MDSDINSKFYKCCFHAHDATEHLEHSVTDDIVTCVNCNMLHSLFLNNNVIPQVGQCVASPRTTSSQDCVFDQTFFLFMYNHDFQLKCSVTAGALGVGTGGQWSSTESVQFKERCFYECFIY